MRILLAGEFQYFWYEEACARALERLGHQVVRFRWAGYFYELLGRLQRRYLIGPALLRLNRGLVACATAERPDVIFIWRGVPIWPSTLKLLRAKADSLLVSYNNDDPFGPSRHARLWVHFLTGIPYFDVHFVYREVNIDEFKAAGAQRVHVLMPYYVPELHHPVQLTDKEQERFGCQVVFVGHYEDDGRLDCLRILAEAGIRVRVYGGDTWTPRVLGSLWSRVGPVCPVYDGEYAKALSGASLCLSFLSRLNRDTYTRRCFEIPACGRLLLSERTDDVTDLYKEDREAVFFSTPHELLAKAQTLLSDPALIDEIASAGRRRCIEGGHDVTNRMQEMYEKLM